MSSSTPGVTLKSGSQGHTSAGLMSKLTNPFASRQNTHIKHEIELQEPFRYFGPGELVKGVIHLNVAKPVRATHLVARLLGFVKVVSHSKLPGESIPYDEALLHGTGGSHGGEYFGGGCARLFEDEVILCGDGRLLGQYEFGFELALPKLGLPSSIDFENGTICYLVTSTLTRPTAISPTMRKELKIRVRENINIAAIPVPAPRSILIDTYKKRRPVINLKRVVSTPSSDRPATSINTSVNSDETRQNSPPNNDRPASPVPSEISLNSFTSSSQSTSIPLQGPMIATSETNSMSGTSVSFAAVEKPIKAKTEVLQGGTLPGETLPIKVSIEHKKAIKSMQGIIITLYRVGKIDTSPALSIGPITGVRGEPSDNESVPKSRTGLGGLSLSSGGSKRTFRQDLAQIITPLIIDPRSLTATIKTTLRVPEYTFPTISNVPGSMLSFRYYVEIVIDLRGRTGQEKLFPKFSMTETSQHAHGDPRINMMEGQDGMTFSTTAGFEYLITDQIRRQKGVFFTKTEIIIGTSNTARTRGKGKETSLEHKTLRPEPIIPQHEHRAHAFEDDESSAPIYTTDHLRSPEDWSAVRPLPAHCTPIDDKSYMTTADNHTSDVNGSDQLRADHESLPSAHGYRGHDFNYQHEPHMPAPAYDDRPSTVLSDAYPANSGDLVPRHRLREPISQGSSSFDLQPNVSKPVDDKQELEIARLRALASSPEISNPQSSLAASDFMNRENDNSTSVDNGTVTGPSLDVHEQYSKAYMASPNGSEMDNSSLHIAGISQPDKQELERTRLHQLVSAPPMDLEGDLSNDRDYEARQSCTSNNVYVRTHSPTTNLQPISPDLPSSSLEPSHNPSPPPQDQDPS